MREFTHQGDAAEAHRNSELAIGETFLIAGDQHYVVDEYWFARSLCGDQHPTNMRVQCHLAHGHGGVHWGYDPATPVDGPSYEWQLADDTVMVCGYGPEELNHSTVMRPRVQQRRTSHFVARDGTAVAVCYHPGSDIGIPWWEVGYVVSGLIRGHH